MSLTSPVDVVCLQARGLLRAFWCEDPHRSELGAGALEAQLARGDHPRRRRTRVSVSESRDLDQETPHVRPPLRTGQGKAPRGLRAVETLRIKSRGVLRTAPQTIAPGPVGSPTACRAAPLATTPAARPTPRTTPLASISPKSLAVLGLRCAPPTSLSPSPSPRPFHQRSRPIDILMYYSIAGQTRPLFGVFSKRRVGRSGAARWVGRIGDPPPKARRPRFGPGRRGRSSLHTGVLPPDPRPGIEERRCRRPCVRWSRGRLRATRREACSRRRRSGIGCSARSPVRPRGGCHWLNRVQSERERRAQERKVNESFGCAGQPRTQDADVEILPYATSIYGPMTAAKQGPARV